MAFSSFLKVLLILNFLQCSGVLPRNIQGLWKYTGDIILVRVVWFLDLIGFGTFTPFQPKTLYFPVFFFEPLQCYLVLCNKTLHERYFYLMLWHDIAMGHIYDMCTYVVFISLHKVLLFTTTEKKQVLRPTQLFDLTSYPFKSNPVKMGATNKLYGRQQCLWR